MTAIIATLATLPIAVNANQPYQGNQVHKSDTKVGKILSDTMITAKIKELYLADKDISSLIIHVTTKDRVVYLSGKVNTSYEKKIAINLAKTVNDVKDVKSNLEVLNT